MLSILNLIENTIKILKRTVDELLRGGGDNVVELHLKIYTKHNFEDIEFYTKLDFVKIEFQKQGYFAK